MKRNVCTLLSFSAGLLGTLFMEALLGVSITQFSNNVRSTLFPLSNYFLPKQIDYHFLHLNLYVYNTQIFIMLILINMESRGKKKGKQRNKGREEGRKERGRRRGGRKGEGRERTRLEVKKTLVLVSARPLTHQGDLVKSLQLSRP